MNFYQIVDGLDLNIPCTTATVLNGPYEGEKAVFADGTFYWGSDENGFIKSHEDIFTDLYMTGVKTVNGTQVYCEILNNSKQMVICGAGHVSIPVIRMGKMLDFHITVIEDRPKFADNARAAGADTVICNSFGEALREIPGDENTYFVIVTRGHRYDLDCIRAIVEKPHAYIGMIGSHSRVKKIIELLKEEGTDHQVVDSVHTPIGLDIAAETPEEIAVAIIAEIIEVKNRNKKNSGYPRDLMKSLVQTEKPGRILATIISRKGSAPREVGAKMLICQDGTVIGSVGGGCVESAVISKARRILVTGAKKIQIYEADMTGLQAEEDGMVCGGVEEILLEYI